MGKFLIGGLIGLILGSVGGVMLLGPAVVGAGTGAGVAVGLTTGICAMAKSAEDLGLLTAEQVDQVLANAASAFGQTEGVPEGTAPVGTTAQCDAALERIRAAGN